MVLVGAKDRNDVFGVSYACGFTYVANLNGDFNDWPGSVSWHKVTSKMGWNNPSNDQDGSFEFACMADGEYLYVAVKITDDKKCVDENVGDAVYNDDSIEVYVEGDNSKPSAYENDCVQITIGRYNLGVDPVKPKLNAFKGESGQGLAASEIGVMAAVVDVGNNWAVEAAIPFKPFKIKPLNGLVIGFNVQLNDDDDGGDRDHKLSWSEKERAGAEIAWQNPSVFGELVFVKGLLAIESKCKLSTCWGAIKTN